MACLEDTTEFIGSAEKQIGVVNANFMIHNFSIVQAGNVIVVGIYDGEYRRNHVFKSVAVAEKLYGKWGKFEPKGEEYQIPTGFIEEIRTVNPRENSPEKFAKANVGDLVFLLRKEGKSFDVGKLEEENPRSYVLSGGVYKTSRGLIRFNSVMIPKEKIDDLYSITI